LKYLENLELNFYFPHILMRQEENINYTSDLLIKFFNNLSKTTLNTLNWKILNNQYLIEFMKKKSFNFRNK
jgi:hypothetical protein